jgi:nucleotide-binding universal stress UspA family protein
MGPLIVVPLDGSLPAERAIPVARTLARADGARLLLLRAVPEHSSSGDTLPQTAAELGQAEGYLDTIAFPLQRAGFQVDTAALRGSPTDVIIDEARRHHATMIVLTTHGRHGAGQQGYGGTTAALLARAAIPLLLVGAQPAHHGLAQGDPGAAIVVPLDGSERAEAALPLANRLAASLGGSLVLVSAVPSEAALVPRTGAIGGHRPIPDRFADMGGYLDNVVGRLDSRAYTIYCEVRVGEPAHVIAEVCRDYDAALIAVTARYLASHDRDGLDTSASAMLHAGQVPVLIVPPPDRVRPGTSGRGATAGLVQDGG